MYTSVKEVQINERKISKISSLAYMYFTGKKIHRFIMEIVEIFTPF